MEDSFLKQAQEGNKTAILKKEIIRQYIICDNVSITDLSKEMNLSVPTVTKLISELKDEGFVIDFGKQDKNGGRRPNIYGLNPDAGYFVGVDLRKDNVAIGLMNFKGQMIDYEWCREFDLENSAQSLEELCRIINKFIDKLRIPRKKILSVGVNLSGRVNSESGYSYSFYFMEEQPLTMLLESQLGCNVYIENDSRAMAYGEYICGAIHDKRNMLFINVSWGLGVGIIVDGKLVYGKSGFSGEYGHFPMFDNEIICRCGKRGCLETEASGSAVHRMLTERLKEGQASTLSDKYKSGQEISIEDIMNAVALGDVLAIEIMEKVGSVLGKAISGLINLFNPELIVIGGTLSAAKDYLMLPIKSAVNKYSLNMVSKDTVIKTSKLGDKVGVIGACMLIRSKTLNLL